MEMTANWDPLIAIAALAAVLSIAAVKQMLSLSKTRKRERIEDLISSQLRICRSVPGAQLRDFLNEHCMVALSPDEFHEVIECMISEGKVERMPFRDGTALHCEYRSGPRAA